MIEIRFGRQVTGDLAAAVDREWLVGDGLGGFAGASFVFEGAWRMRGPA